MTVATATIGGIEVARLGLGCMVLTRAYTRPDQAEAEATMRLALDLGITLLDTADAYDAGENEIFVGRVLDDRRDDVVLSSKFGLGGGLDVPPGINGRPEYLKACCERSLQRLGTDRLDIYYQHRVDPDVPLTETVGAMAELVAEGKVRHLGLCEVSAAELESAHTVHPITVVQSEWSLWARQIEGDALPAARRLGVGLVPYSPLGRGFLAGAVRAEGDLDSDDLRRADPRLKGTNLRRNLELVAALEAFATERDATPAQIALAWLLVQGDDVVPIPGCERRDLLRQNAGALSVQLTAADIEQLGGLFPLGVASGNPDETLRRTVRPHSPTAAPKEQP